VSLYHLQAEEMVSSHWLSQHSTEVAYRSSSCQFPCARYWRQL